MKAGKLEEGDRITDDGLVWRVIHVEERGAGEVRTIEVRSDDPGTARVVTYKRNEDVPLVRGRPLKE